MNKRMRKTAAGFLAAAMLFGGALPALPAMPAITAEASSGQTIPIALGVKYYLGDTIDFGSSEVWAYFFHMSASLDDSYSTSPENFQGITIKLDWLSYEESWDSYEFGLVVNGNQSYSMDVDSKKDGAVGVVVSEGDGTEQNPYQFELIYGNTPVIVDPPVIEDPPVIGGEALSYDENTHVLTITGALEKEDLEPYLPVPDYDRPDEVFPAEYPVSKVIAAEGAVMPANCQSLFVNIGYEADEPLVLIDLSKADFSHVTNMHNMFVNSGAQEINLSGTDLSHVTSMESTFAYCESLKLLDLRGCNTSRVENVRSMFTWCTNLETILADENWTTANVCDDYDMFYLCSKLVGEQGTAYDSEHTTSEYARLDTPQEPGYFSSQTPQSAVTYDAATETLTIRGRLKEEDLEPYKATGEFTDGEIVWFEPEYPVKRVIAVLGAVMPKDCKWLFARMTADTSAPIELIDLSLADFSQVETMNYMFYHTNVREIDLSNILLWKTSSLAGLCYECTGLQTIDLSGVNPRHVKDMSKMFEDCTNLRTIYTDMNWYGGHFTVENSQDMFTNCTSLVGGSGTVYDPAQTGNELACIDKADAPGYFTQLTRYDLRVAEKTVTARNAADILRDGTVSYDAKKKTLTLNGANIVLGKADEMFTGITSEIDGLTIRVAADSTIITNGIAVELYEDTTITGPGKLTAKCIDEWVGEPEYDGIYISGATLTFDCANIEAYGDSGIGAGGSNNDKLVIVNSTIDASGMRYAISNFMDGTVFTDCTIKQPAGAAMMDYTDKWNNTFPTVCNADGTAATSVRIEASGQTKITQQPVAVTAAVGETATFTVAAAGSGLKYQWQYSTGDDNFKNSGASGSTTNTLTINAKVAYHAYKYRCVITDANGKDTISKAVRLLVKPAVKTQPVNVTTEVGKTAKFTVTAVGVGTLRYQWQYNAGSGWKDSGATGSTTAALSINAKTSYNNYQYRCIVTDVNNRTATSKAAKLVVKPAITVQPVAVTAAVGETATFTVTAAGSGLKYQWQYSTGDDNFKNSGAAGSTTKTLTINAKAAYHAYKYRCVITDANGNTAISKAVRLLVKPAIKTQPVDITAEIGKTAVFTITAAGVGTLSYQWQYNAGSEWKNSGAAGSTTAALSINAKAAYNNYQYRCVVTDVYGRTATSNAAKLVIKTAITAQPVNVTAAAGETAAFTVTAAGAGLKYQWQYSTGDDNFKNSNASGSTTKTLTINAKVAYHAYKYRCVITDANGKTTISKAARLLVKPAINTQPANITVTAGKTAKFTVEAVGVGTLSYQWQYNAGSGWKDSGASGSTTATLSISAKAAYNNYQYRCVVTDVYGRTATSNAAKLTIK